MNIEQAKLRIQKLKKQIIRHNDAYYIDDAPTITDASFDLLYKELVDIERQFPVLVQADSPSQRVGGKAKISFSQKNKIGIQFEC